MLTAFVGIGIAPRQDFKPTFVLFFVILPVIDGWDKKGEEEPRAQMLLIFSLSNRVG